MKAVLISIHPRHCGNIASGKKTVEVRKTVPKLKTPFRCYIYCTSVKSLPLEEYVALHASTDGLCDKRSGKVIGEFVCDRIDTIRDEGNGFVAGGVQPSEWHSSAQTLIQAACLTEKELKAYLGNDYGYGWHISDLKIYDKPKELSEFRKPCDRFLDCFLCRRYKRDEFGGCDSKIHRPPQSYMFVEEI